MFVSQQKHISINTTLAIFTTAVPGVPARRAARSRSGLRGRAACAGGDCTRHRCICRIAYRGSWCDFASIEVTQKQLPRPSDVCSRSGVACIGGLPTGLRAGAITANTACNHINSAVPDVIAPARWSSSRRAPRGRSLRRLRLLSRRWDPQGCAEQAQQFLGT